MVNFSVPTKIRSMLSRNPNNNANNTAKKVAIVAVASASTAATMSANARVTMAKRANNAKIMIGDQMFHIRRKHTPEMPITAPIVMDSKVRRRSTSEAIITGTANPLTYLVPYGNHSQKSNSQKQCKQQPEKSKSNSKSSSNNNVVQRNESIVLYKSQGVTDEYNKAMTLYEICYELEPIAHCYSLLKTDSKEGAEKLLHNKLMTILNKFVLYFADNEQTLYQDLVELVECYRDNQRWNPSHFAAYFSHEKYFLDHQNIRLKDFEDTANPEQWSTLHIAALSGNIDIVKLLIKTRMNVYLVDARGWTVMHYAVLAPAKTIDFLVIKPAFYEQLRLVDNNGCTPIHIACLTGQISVMERLMLQGLTSKMLSITAPKLPKDPLDLYQDHTPYVSFTMKEVTEEFDVDAITVAGCPLHWAQSLTLLDRLLNLNVFRINLRNSLGDTPLITYIKRLGDMVKRNHLIGNGNGTGSANGSGVNSTFANSATPMKDSRRSQNYRTNQQISEKEPSEQSSSQSVTQQLSAAEQSTLVLQQQQQFSASGAQQPLMSNNNDRLCWLMRLITSGARINAKNEENNSALHYAVINYDIASVQMLIIFGARINLRNKHNHSALHLATNVLTELQSSNDGNGNKNNGSMSSNQLRHNSPTGIAGSAILRASPSSRVNYKQIHYSRQSKQFSNAGLNARKSSLRLEQICSEIIQLLQSVNARRCPRGVSHCGPHCAYNVRNQAKAPTVSMSSDESTSASYSNKVDNKVENLIVSFTDDARKIVRQLYHMIKDNGATKKMDHSIIESSIESSTNESKSSKGRKSNSSKKSSAYQEKQQERLISQAQGRNMLSLDGGYSEGGVKPLIEVLVLNELQCYLTRPIQEYFEILAGSGYGSIIASMLSINRSTKEVFYFFLRLKEFFRTPLISSLEYNTDLLERFLYGEFGNLKLSDIATQFGKHLMLATLKIDIEPTRLEMMSSIDNDCLNLEIDNTTKDDTVKQTNNQTDEQNNFTIINNNHREWTIEMWKALRASGAGLGCYKNYDCYYDGSVCSANPTLDALSYYQLYLQKEMVIKALVSHQNSIETNISKEISSLDELISKESNPISSIISDSETSLESIDRKMLPLNFVLSIGSGLNPPLTGITPVEINNYTTFNPAELVKNFQYFMRIKDMLIVSMTETDNYCNQRARLWCESLNASFARINFIFYKDPSKIARTQSLSKLIGNGTMLRTSPVRHTLSIPAIKDDQLLQILWNIKVNMVEERHKFSKIACYLELSYELNFANNNTTTNVTSTTMNLTE